MNRYRLLRGTLVSNAVFSAICGGIMLLAGEPLAGVLGLPDPLPLALLGPGLLGFALFLVHLARQPKIPPTLAAVVSFLDLAWIVGSAILLLGWPALLSGTGRLLVVAVAMLVGFFASLQLAGIRRLIANDGRGRARSMLQVERFVPVPASVAWTVIADLDHYAEVAPNLSFARVLEGQGEGLLRECGDYHGGRWTETCTRWEDGRSYSMRVHTEAQDYPYPLRALSGTWQVEPAPDGTRITMRFDFTVRGGIVGELLAAAFQLPAFERDAEAVLRNWETRLRTEAETQNQTAIAVP